MTRLDRSLVFLYYVLRSMPLHWERLEAGFPSRIDHNQQDSAGVEPQKEPLFLAALQASFPDAQAEGVLTTTEP